MHLRANADRISYFCEFCRYKLPIVVIVMNNNGIYGGDRRAKELQDSAQKGADSAGFGDDPIPTAFVENSRFFPLSLPPSPSFFLAEQEIALLRKSIQA